MKKKKIAVFLIFVFVVGKVALFSQDGGSKLLTQRFEWYKPEYAVRYTFILEQRQGTLFQEVIRKFVTDTYLDLSLSAGTYRYKILSYNILGKLDAESDWIDLNIFQAYQPGIIHYSPDEFYFDRKVERTIRIEGSNFVDGAEIFLLRRGGSRDTPKDRINPGKVQTNDLGSTAQLIFEEKDMAEGIYDIIVKNPGGLEASAGPFSIWSASPIVMESPISGMILSGKDAVSSPPLARWRSKEALYNALLIISRDYDPVGDPQAKVVAIPKGANSVPFPPLGEGRWYFTIKASTYDDRSIRLGDPSWITVLAIPPFPSPGGFQPQNETRISLKELTIDRCISFRWNEIAGANAYIFSLFTNESQPETVIVAEPSPETSYILRDLTILKQDSYKWQVEAVLRNNSGVIEQRGLVEAHTFYLEIGQSSDLRVTNPGTLFGN